TAVFQIMVQPCRAFAAASDELRQLGDACVPAVMLELDARAGGCNRKQAGRCALELDSMDRARIGVEAGLKRGDDLLVLRGPAMLPLADQDRGSVGDRLAHGPPPIAARSNIPAVEPRSHIAIEQVFAQSQYRQFVGAVVRDEYILGRLAGLDTMGALAACERVQQRPHGRESPLAARLQPAKDDVPEPARDPRAPRWLGRSAALDRREQLLDGGARKGALAIERLVE